MLKLPLAISIAFITAFANSQSADVSLPIGKSTFTVDANKKINWTGSALKYDLGNLKYAGSFSNNSQVHNFNTTLSNMTMSYVSSLPKNTIGITFRGATFTSEDFNRNEVQNVFASKLLISQRNTLSYKQKDLSLSMSKTTGNISYDSYSFANKKIKVDYVSSESPLMMLDAWNRPYASKTQLSLKLPSIEAKIMDNYDDVLYSSKNLSIRSINHLSRSENTLNYFIKGNSVSYTNFNDGYSKNFLNVSGKDYKLKMASDDDTSISQLEFKGTTIAHGDDQSFIQSKIGKMEYRLSDGVDDLNYDVKLGNLGVRNGEAYGVVQPIKNFSIKASSENGMEQASYSSMIGNTNVSLKYNNQFDVYDFYFKQNAFSVYENSFSMIGQSRAQFKDSFSFSLVNPKFNLSSDVINDIYAVMYKNSNNFSFSMIKDQKQNFMSVTNSGRLGSFSAQYNMDTHLFDRFAFNFSVKFR
jgi:hypothetical protein